MAIGKTFPCDLIPLDSQLEVAMKEKGTLVIIGGAEDKKGPCLILRKFVELAGGKKARLVIMTAATQHPLKVGAAYQEVFKRLGCPQAELFDVPDRQRANEKEALELIRQASGVFFCGGDQLRITSALGGTELEEVLKEGYRTGLVLAGTSAGASVMSSTMISEGDSDDSPKLNTLKMSAGMGFLPEVAVDQHFAQRGRIGRLLTALGQNPSILGLGLDEDTAVLVKDNRLLVWGSQTVTVLDGRRITHSNASSADPGQHLALTEVIVHILPHGYGFDLRARKPILPSDGLKTPIICQ